MKKTALIVCTAALAAIMNFPAFAAQTKAEYKTESAQIRQELETAGNSIKSLKDENKTISASVNAARKAQKEAGQIKENKDTWKQVNELKDRLPAIKVSYVEASGQVKLLKAQAGQDAREGRYDEALGKMSQALEQKKESLKYAEQMNSVWDQIDQLIK